MLRDVESGMNVEQRGQLEVNCGRVENPDYHKGSDKKRSQVLGVDLERKTLQRARLSGPALWMCWGAVMVGLPLGR